MANGFLNDLVAYWDMEDTGNLDDIHTGAAWELQGFLGPPTRVAGKLGSQSAAFINTSVVCQDLLDRAQLDFRQNPMVSFTVSFWFKPVAALQTSGATWLWEQYDDASVSEGGWGIVARGQLTPQDAALIYRVDASTTKVVSTFGDTMASGTWYHVAAGYDADTQEMFIALNSQYSAVVSTDQVMTKGNVLFTLGGWHANGTQYANSHIDELAVWSRALTSAEITQLYNGGSGVPYSSFDTGAAETETGTKLDVDLSDPAPLFSRSIEVTGHLLATPRDTGSAAITVVYLEEDL